MLDNRPKPLILRRLSPRIVVGFLCAFAPVACGKSDPDPRPSVLRLAVTTSTRDSGLLDAVIPPFEKHEAVRVDVIAVGTGKALKLGQAGDVDVLLVHSRADEDAFMAAGHGTRREDVMLNTFEILGPQGDPAKVKTLSPAGALETIAAGKFRFVSRGDDSGTHKRELALWHSAGGRPDWEHYIQSGQGMGATLIMADQMQAYVLADRGTYLSLKDKIDLRPLVKTTEALANPYGIIVVDPAKHPSIPGPLADAFVDYLISAPAQRLIRDHQIGGERLFTPLHPTE